MKEIVPTRYLFYHETPLSLIFAALFLSMSVWANEANGLLWSSQFIAKNTNPYDTVFESTNGLIDAPNISIDYLTTNVLQRFPNFYIPCALTTINGNYAFAPYRAGMINGWSTGIILEGMGDFLASGGKITSISFDLFAFDVSSKGQSIIPANLFCSLEHGSESISKAVSIPSESSPEDTTRATFIINDKFFSNISGSNLLLDININAFHNITTGSGIGIANMEVHGTLSIPEPSGILLGIFALTSLSLVRRRA